MSTLDAIQIASGVLAPRMLQLAMDHLPQAIFWKDRDLVYLGCNQDAGWIRGRASDCDAQHASERH